MAPEKKPEDEKNDPTLNLKDSVSSVDLNVFPGATSGSFLSIGSLIEGKYRLVDSLGEGGMGVVYKVEQVMLNRQMALKTLTGNEFSESSIKRFHAEAKVLAKLDHPGLVKIQDFGFIDNVKPFLVMDFVQGRTLSSVLKTSGVMPMDLAIKIFVELCFALGYAHSKDIVHRDIKPSNIMLTTPGLDSENEHVKVLDFGIAKLLHRGSDTDALTRTGEIFGSPLYMSPEQCAGRPVDHRSDIYSMGCVMFEVLTGAPPFSGETSLATMMIHQSDKPLSLREASMGREFPPEIEKLVASMLEKEPDKRIQSLLDVAQILIGVQKGISGGKILNTEVKLPDVQATEKAHRQQSHYVSYAILAFLILGVGLLTLLFLNQQSNSPNTGKAADDSPELPKGDWCRLSPDRQVKIFSFPKSYSLGRLSFGNTAERQRIDAQGEVLVPVGSEISFAPNGYFLAHPQFLRKFKPDDITELDFKETGVSDRNQASIQAKNPLTNDELIYCKHLTGLRRLGLKNCSVSDEGLEYLKNLKLHALNVDGTDVTVKGLKSLHCFKNLLVLRACHLKDGGAIIKALAGSNMRFLALTGSDLKNADIKGLQQLPNLQEASLGYNPDLDDRCLPDIQKLKNLRLIALDQTEVTAEAALKCFKQMNLTHRPRMTIINWTAEQRAELDRNWPRN